MHGFYPVHPGLLMRDQLVASLARRFAIFLHAGIRMIEIRNGLSVIAVDNSIHKGLDALTVWHGVALAVAVIV